MWVIGPQAQASTGKRATAAREARNATIRVIRLAALVQRSISLRDTRGLACQKFTVTSRRPQSNSPQLAAPPDGLSHKARAFLEREIDLGLETVPLTVAAPPGAPVLPPPPAPSDAAPDLLLEPAIRDAASLEALRAVLGDCTRCKLAGGRKTIVFGVGNPAAELMFIGEGPGEEEDIQGLPFVGRAGSLLTDIITKGMGLRREDVYIANVIKCRPPNNRNPELDEIAACEPFLRKQIALVRPKVIVALGKFAAQVLLRSRVPISKLRGVWSEFDRVPLMPTFHPAYLLRNPSDKRLVWEDVKQVLERLGLPIPQRGR
jgi:uracil-DNA glycosylase family 4